MATDLSPIDVTTDGYAALYDQLNAQLEAMMTGLVAEVTGQPDDALRLNREAKRFERWDDAAGQWKPAIERYDMDVTRLGGQKPATAATAHSIAQRLADGRLKAGAPSEPDDVLRAFELAQHLEADNPHELGKTDVELGEVNNAAQLERGQNLADLVDKDAARGPSGLDLGDAARRWVGTQNGRLALWENIPRPGAATTATAGLARFATVYQHQQLTSGAAATPVGVNQMGFAKSYQIIGYGQSWQDVQSSRSSNTQFQNTTGRPIVWIAEVRYIGGNMQVKQSYYSTWISLMELNDTRGYSGTVIVPNGHYYRLTGDNFRWSELR